MNKKFITLTAVIFSIALINAKSNLMTNKTHTLFLPRSQGMNTAHWITSYRQMIPGCDDYADSFWKILLEYGQSFKGDDIAKYLFGAKKLRFTGSEYRNRKSSDILADYFGLPLDYHGTISFDPKIENVQIALQYRLLLDSWAEGLYFEINAPINVTRTYLNIREKRKKKPNLSLLPAGYMGPEESKSASSICQGLSGNFLFGDMKEPWSFGRFVNKQQKYGISGLNLFLGWNFLLDKNKYLSAYILNIMPTGSKIRSRRVFAPVIGNGGLWELGLGSEGRYSYIFGEDHEIGIWFNGVFTYQFKTDQIRTFGFKNRGKLSQYMLLKQLHNPGESEDLMNGIDFATRAVRAGGSIVGDASVKLAYYYSRLALEAGYNVYGKSMEKLRLLCDVFPSDLNQKRFGLKGTSGAYYKFYGNFYSLDATQNNANINRGGRVDNPELVPGAETFNDEVVYKSEPPVLLSVNDLDLETGLVPPQLSHKFFFRIGYLDFKACYEPQIGIAGQVEFNGKRNLSAVNQWTVWIDGSLAF